MVRHIIEYMATVEVSKKGISYLKTILRQTQNAVSRAIFWKIPHHSDKEDICLKLGRYKRRILPLPESPEVLDPKSELTLDDEELRALLKFLSENYEPFRIGVTNFIALDQRLDPSKVEHLKAVFANPDRDQLLKFIAENNIITADLMLSLQSQARRHAIQEFIEMLHETPAESAWQAWFKTNDWVLGTEFVRILDERDVDTKHIADFLVQAHDGFLDIVEIKKPDPTIKIWADTKDHGNLIPSSDLVKAITQATRYVYEVEREANSIKFLERVGYVRTVKPRCVLIFGRSTDWSDEHREAFRILNSSYHNLSLMTYDHVLDRARRIVGETPAVQPVAFGVHATAAVKSLGGGS